MFYCELCPRRCRAPRGETGRGFCGLGENPVVARAALHFDEEPCISGSRGSGAVFFSGCTLGCVYCQNWRISHERFGRELKKGELRQVFDRLIEDEAHNINLVTGTPFTRAIIEAIEEKPMPVPVVWNSSGYERLETLKMLRGRVQVYLPDLKYLDVTGAREYSQAADYPEAAKKALREMARQVGEPVFDEEDVMVRGMIVRHLILPGRVRQSMRVLDWIHDNLPEGTYVSLMAQYLPCGRAKDMPPLDRRITQAEYDQVVDHMIGLGMENGFAQELSSASEVFIPPFDLTGVGSAD